MEIIDKVKKESSGNRCTWTIGQSVKSALKILGAIEPWKMGLITAISQLNGILFLSKETDLCKKNKTILCYENMKLNI